MKKTILALAIIAVFAASSFASVSLMTAQGVGAGKWDVLGVYGTNHYGPIANSGGDETISDPQVYDSISLGVKGVYGMMDGLDLVLGLSSDTSNYAALKAYVAGGSSGAIQTSGRTVSVGIKYTLPEKVIFIPVDTAVLAGYENSDLSFNIDTGGNNGSSVTSYVLGAIFSRQIGACLPYCGIAVKSLSQQFAKGGVDPVDGTGLMLDYGIYFQIHANDPSPDQAIVIEYDTENDSWDKPTKAGHAMAGYDDGSATSVSGLSIGYIYIF